MDAERRGDADGLGRGQDGAGTLDRPALVRSTTAQVPERRDQHVEDCRRRPRTWPRSARPRLVACRRTRSISAARSAIGSTSSKLKRRFSAADISETPRSRRLAVAITLKPGAAYSVPSSSPAVSSGTDIRRSDRIETRASWTSGRQRVTSSIRTTAPVRIACRTGRCHERFRRRALREQEGVVPAVLDLVLGRPGGALHRERRAAADRRRQQLRQHRLGGPRLADEQQAALSRDRHDAALDQARGRR